MKPKESTVRIKLEDGSVIRCTEHEIIKLVEYRLKNRMDISEFKAAYFYMTGKELPKPMIV